MIFFMYYAIKFGWITLHDVTFENLALDIETLNLEALKNTYDITAISFALYPKIRNDYALLRTAVSFLDRGMALSLSNAKDETQTQF